MDFSFRKKKAKPKTRPQNPRTGHPRPYYTPYEFFEMVYSSSACKYNSRESGPSAQVRDKVLICLGIGITLRIRCMSPFRSGEEKLTSDERNEGREPLEYDEHGIPILNVRSRLSEVERKASEAETRDKQYKNRQESINFRLMAFTGLLVLTSLLTGGIAIWQANIANRSAKAAESAAKTAATALEDAEKPTSDVHISAIAAKNAADTAAEALKSSETLAQADRRPYVVVEENYPAFVDAPSTKTPVKVNVTLKNIGKTSAIQIINQVHFYERHGKLLNDSTQEEISEARRQYISFMESQFSKMHQNDGRARKEMQALASLSPGRDLSPNQTMLLTPEEEFSLKDTDVPLVVSGETFFAVMGVASYIDSNGNPYTTEYCYQFFGPYPKIWHICDSHNKNH
jgi:hypothetical protein